MDGIEVRRIRESEYGEARKLWDACFPEDAGDYSKWYFEKKTKPEYVYAAFDGGAMLSCLHALPYPLVFTNASKRSVTLPMAMIAGVATYEACRHRGIAARVIRHAHAALRDAGVYAAVLKPDVDFYAQFGYLPFARHDEYEYSGADDPSPLHEPSPSEALAMYSRFSVRYEGMMARTERDMALLIEEAKLSGFAWAYKDAYAFGALTDGGVELSELAGADTEHLVRALGASYGRVRFRLPRGAEAGCAKKTGEVVFSMLCPLDSGALLQKTGAESVASLLERRCCTLEFC